MSKKDTGKGTDKSTGGKDGKPSDESKITDKWGKDTTH